VTTVLNPGDRWATSLVEAGYNLGPNEVGTLAWIQPRPDMFNGAIEWFDQGSTPNGGTGSSTDYLGQISGGTRTEVTPTKRIQGACALNTGTTTTGRIAYTIGTNLQLSSTSGVWVTEIMFMIPTLDDGIDKYSLLIGLFDVVGGGVGQADGVYLLYDNTSNGADFKFVTSANSTRTTTDTGIAVQAGVWYRLKIVLTNNSTASCFLTTDSLGWSYGAAKATNTTNIPTGAGRETGGGIAITKAAGTNSRSVQYVTMHIWREPSRATPAIAVDGGDLMLGHWDGLALPAPAPGQVLCCDDSGNPVWSERRWRAANIPYLAFDCAVSNDYNSTTSGASAAVVNTASVSGQPQIEQLATGTTATGYALRTAFTWGSGLAPCSLSPYQGGTAADRADSQWPGVFVYECLFQIPTLSNGTDTHLFFCGWSGGNAPPPTSGDGVFVQIDSNADTHLICKTMDSGTATSTTTSLVISANTWYFVRIVVRPGATQSSLTTVDFYCAALGTSLGSPLATHTTNVPTDPNDHGQGVGPVACLVKTVGTSSKTANIVYQLAYARQAS